MQGHNALNLEHLAAGGRAGGDAPAEDISEAAGSEGWRRAPDGEVDEAEFKEANIVGLLLEDAGELVGPDVGADDHAYNTSKEGGSHAKERGPQNTRRPTWRQGGALVEAFGLEVAQLLVLLALVGVEDDSLGMLVVKHAKRVALGLGVGGGLLPPAAFRGGGEVALGSAITVAAALASGNVGEARKEHVDNHEGASHALVAVDVFLGGGLQPLGGVLEGQRLQVDGQGERVGRLLQVPARAGLPMLDVVGMGRLPALRTGVSEQGLERAQEARGTPG